MATATYEPIATTTLGSAVASITFSSIAATWTDLRLVLTYTKTITGGSIELRFNSDIGANYSETALAGDGTSGYSGRDTSYTYVEASSMVYGESAGIQTMLTIDVFSYANATYKTALLTESNDQNGGGSADRMVGLWRSTAAITSMQLAINSTPVKFAAGTTATLYGIKAA